MTARTAPTLVRSLLIIDGWPPQPEIREALRRELRALLAVARAIHRLLHNNPKGYRMPYRTWSDLVDADKLLYPARAPRRSGERGR